LDRDTLLFLKKRITFPRTGYVAPPPAPPEKSDQPITLQLNADDVPFETPTTAPGFRHLP
jgi:hypothetical protein